MVADWIVVIAISGIVLTGLLELGIAYKLLRNYNRYNLSPVRILLLSFVFGLSSRVVELYRISINPLNYIQTSGGLDSLFGILAAYIFLVFLNYYEENKLSAPKLSVTTFLATLTLFSDNQTIIDTLFELSVPIGFIIAFSRIIFFVFIIVVTIRTLDRVKTYATEKQLSSIRFVRYYVYFSFGGLTVVYSLATVVFGTDIDQFGTFQYLYFAILPTVMILLADLSLYLGYVRKENPAVLQPQRIDKFVIITGEGLPVYSRQVDIEAGTVDDTLLSGALTAISAVLKEATNVVGNLKSIEIGDRKVILHQAGNLTGVLFAFEVTQFLREALVSLMKFVEEEFGDQSVNEVDKSTELAIDNKFEEIFGV